MFDAVFNKERGKEDDFGDSFGFLLFVHLHYDSVVVGELDVDATLVRVL